MWVRWCQRLCERAEEVSDGWRRFRDLLGAGKASMSLLCAKVTRQFSDGHLWPAEMVQQPPWHLCWWKRCSHARGGGMEPLSSAAEV